MLNLRSYAVSRGDGQFADSLREYARRLQPFLTLEMADFASEKSLIDRLAKPKSRTAPMLVLLDSRGTSFTSEAFAAWLGRERDGGRQSIVFAIGPANGWSEEAVVKKTPAKKAAAKKSVRKKVATRKADAKKAPAKSREEIELSSSTPGLKS